VRLDYVRATELAARTGQAIAVLFALVGALMPNPMLVIIALFVWMGAAAEASLAQLKRALRGMTVDTAMRTEFGTLAPADALGGAAEMAIRARTVRLSGSPGRAGRRFAQRPIWRAGAPTAFTEASATSCIADSRRLADLNRSKQPSTVCSRILTRPCS
jgi:hypothetical protein